MLALVVTTTDEYRWRRTQFGTQLLMLVVTIAMLVATCNGTSQQAQGHGHSHAYAVLSPLVTQSALESGLLAPGRVRLLPDGSGFVQDFGS